MMEVINRTNPIPTCYETIKREVRTDYKTSYIQIKSIFVLKIVEGIRVQLIDGNIIILLIIRYTLRKVIIKCALDLHIITTRGIRKRSIINFADDDLL